MLCYPIPILCFAIIDREKVRALFLIEQLAHRRWSGTNKQPKKRPNENAAATQTLTQTNQ